LHIEFAGDFRLLWPFATVALSLTLGQTTTGVTDEAIAPPDLVARASAEFTFTPRATGESDDIPASIDASIGDDGAPNSAFATMAAALGQVDDATSQPQSGHRKNEFFHQGSWRWQLTGSVASDFNDVSLGMFGAAFSYFIERDLTIDFELNTLYINQQGEASNTGAVNASMLVRWHVCMDQRDQQHPCWSVYADAGGGVLYAASDVPFQGSHFNFTPQAGFGASFLIDRASDTRLLTGVRWFHISNANVFDSNDGVDSLMVYAGINFAF
jgi:hypothetical protein